MKFSVIAVFVVFYSLFAISHSAPAICSSATPPPQDRLDVILAEKLSAVSDKSTIPDFDSALQLNTQTTHLPCPDSEHDPRRFSSPAFNIKSVIPWTYKEYTSDNPQKPIYPVITDAVRCDVRIFRCPSGYADLEEYKITYHLVQQTTCTENPNQYDMKLVKFRVATAYSCQKISQS